MKLTRRTILIFVLVLLVSALVWAAVELSGQVNALAQDAGRHSADMEMIALRSVKNPAQLRGTSGPPPCNWAAERKLNSALEANDARYRELIAQALKETIEKGHPSETTSRAVLEQAAAFQGLADQYAAIWEACGCTTRAKTARAIGQARTKSAVVAASEYNQAGQAAMNSAHEVMIATHAQYAQKAVTDQEISSVDKQDIKANLVPQTEALIERINQYLLDIRRMRDQVRTTSQDRVRNILVAGLDNTWVMPIQDQDPDRTYQGLYYLAGHKDARDSSDPSQAITLQKTEGIHSGAVGLSNQAKALQRALLSIVTGQWSTGGLASLPCFLDTTAD